jgi:hypothetical protein
MVDQKPPSTDRALMFVRIKITGTHGTVVGIALDLVISTSRAYGGKCVNGL